MTEPLSSKKAVRLRGRSFLALALSPELPFSEWLAGLDDLARRSTGFFLGRPIILDVAGLKVSRDELASLVEELTRRNVRIMGIEGALPSQLGPGMPPEMRGGRPAGAETRRPEEGRIRRRARGPGRRSRSGWTSRARRRRSASSGWTA